MKNILLTLFSSCYFFVLPAQEKSLLVSPSNSTSFIEFQRMQTRPAVAFNRWEDTLQKQFENKGLKWPANFIYIRSFKFDSQLEIWVKNEKKENFKLFKTYKVCALAGTLGPKRMEGDYQVPEGFYYINEFNPRSSYHLSLGLNYPNTSDKILSDSLMPGSEIYIHGSCVTVGCIPLTDPIIEEVYTIASYAKEKGQDFIPVHIFPIRYNVEKSVEYLERLTKQDIFLKNFSTSLEDAFNYFEKNKQLPVVMINEDGKYLVNDAPVKKAIVKIVEPLTVVKNIIKHRVRNISDANSAFHQGPIYPGGTESFAKYLDKLGYEMHAQLPKNYKKTYVQVQFFVDKDGVPVNFTVLKGLNEEFNEALILKMESTMENWQPALLSNQPVPKKLVQTITVDVAK